MPRILCPDRHYQGTVGGLAFRDGVATTTDLAAIAYLRDLGYEVLEDPGTPEPPAGNASQEAWADWFIANVPGVSEDWIRASSRDDLRDLYATTHDPK